MFIHYPANNFRWLQKLLNIPWNGFLQRAARRIYLNLNDTRSYMLTEIPQTHSFHDKVQVTIYHRDVFAPNIA